MPLHHHRLEVGPHSDFRSPLDLSASPILQSSDDDEENRDGGQPRDPEDWTRTLRGDEMSPGIVGSNPFSHRSQWGRQPASSGRVTLQSHPRSVRTCGYSSDSRHLADTLTDLL